MMHMNFQETRAELMMRKIDFLASFQNVYEGTHIACSMSKTDLFFIAFDSSLLHFLYLQSDGRRIEESFAEIDSTEEILLLINDFERRKCIYPHFHYFFSERPCFETYINYATAQTKRAVEQIREVYTREDYAWIASITSVL